MALDCRPSAARSSIDFTISDEELAWLSSLGDGLPPRELPQAHRTADVLDLLDWSQQTESDTANMRSDADWRAWGRGSNTASGACAKCSYAHVVDCPAAAQYCLQPWSCNVTCIRCQRTPASAQSR